MIEFADQCIESNVPAVRMKVFGIGGAGNNSINSMVRLGLTGVEFVAANTDAQALDQSCAHTVIQLGTKLTKGLGSGANPEVGRRATEEDIELLHEKIDNSDVVFLIAGLGGGTGSGGIPVVARALRERNVLSIAVVTKPFAFEGKRRMRVAEEALEQLRGLVDTLVVIPNQKLINVADAKVSLVGAFELINEYTGQFVRSISDIITKPGHINVDFADVQTIMRKMGAAVMGTGLATGEHRAIEATRQAISSPLLEEQGMKGARSVLLNISGSSNLGLHEASEAAQMVYEEADPEANIVFGSVVDESLGDAVSVTIIATGFDQTARVEARAPEVVRAATMHRDQTVAQVLPEQPAPQAQQPAARMTEMPIITDGMDELDIPAILRTQQQRPPEPEA